MDESLRGYQAKYDCSSGDLNPIGNINKHDIRDFLKWFAIKFNMPVLNEIAETSPTSELRPIKKEEDTHHNFDEQAMEFTYAELDEFGKLRKLGKSGPVTMFKRLLFQWPQFTPREVADKVKRFFYHYSRNRHKMCVITPSYHVEGYSADDNRFDQRQFLYDTNWVVQFKEIDRLVFELEAEEQAERAKL